MVSDHLAMSLLTEQVHYGKKKILVTMELNSLSIVLYAKNAVKLEMKLRDVLGAKLVNGKNFLVFECRQSKNLHRIVVDHCFEFLHNSVAAKEWTNVIQHVACNMPFQTISDIRDILPAKRRFKVILNPSSGSGKALKIFKRKVKPMLEKASVEIIELVTRHKNHAFEDIKSETLNFDCIVVLGGDGTLSEGARLVSMLKLMNIVVHGLLHRSDWQSAIQVPIGVVGGGSGNGLAYSVATRSGEKYSAIANTFIILKGQTMGLDIASTENGKDKVYSFLSLEWAMIANIDIESEKYRCFGGARFTISSLAKIISSQVWSGTFSYLPDDHRESKDYFDLNLHSLEIESEQKTMSEPSTFLLPNIDQDVPENWKIIKGAFQFFWVVSAPYASSDAFVAPRAKFDDGYLYAVFSTRKLSLCQKFTILSDMEKGIHVNHKHVVVIRTRAYRIESDSQKDLMAIDGERCKNTRTQAEVHKCLARIRCVV